MLAMAAAAKAETIIPMPLSMEKTEGDFQFSKSTTYYVSKGLESEMKFLQGRLEPVFGYQLKSGQADMKGAAVRLILDPSLKTLGDEGYTLSVTEKRIEIRAPKAAGVFYGIQSVVQLLPNEVVAKSKQDVKWTLPCVEISDKPRFKWRAMMLDEARHFKGMKEVKKLLDNMSALKLNVFHWHLTDDQGWRIEIKKYPKLTEIGSKRKDSQVGGWDSKESAGEPHGGFYTQEEIKEIVAYAKARHITIVPEIGMPGHATAAIAAYTRLGAAKKKVDVRVKFGKSYDVYDPSDEYVYQFISDVMDEVIELFPSQVIHIGGDEVRFDQWKQSKSVQKLMKDKGLKTMADVQIYFTNRVADIVQKKGRNIMGWNEILGDDLHGFLKDGQTASAAKLDKDTVVHFWKGSPDLAKRAIKKGHTVVNSTHSMTYLDYGYGSISVGKAYSYDPVIGGLTEEEQKSIIGFGCQMWSEWIPTVERMEFQIYPRIAAYAEVGWTEKSRKDYGSFKKRMGDQLARWDILGIHYAKDTVAVLSKADFFNHEKMDVWSAKTTPKDWTKQTFSTNGKIKSAGDIEVAFIYSKGQHALEISEVELLENGKVVATDKHAGFSGGKLKQIVYTLKLKKHKKGAKYTLRANVKGAGGTDSHGEIKARYAE